MGDLQKKLSNIAEICGKREVTTNELFIAFGIEYNDYSSMESLKKITKDDFHNLYSGLGKKIYENLCLLIVCFYLNKIRA